jgi:hypothetical protein
MPFDATVYSRCPSIMTSEVDTRTAAHRSAHAREVSTIASSYQLLAVTLGVHILAGPQKDRDTDRMYLMKGEVRREAGSHAKCS